MRTSRHCFSRTPRFVPIALCITLAVAATAQSPDVRELLNRMEASHAFPPGCSMTASAEATTTWSGVPDLRVPGTLRDTWTAMSDGEGYGVEVRYATHLGTQRWRTIQAAGERRRFDFATQASDVPEGSGSLSVWRGREERWAPPIAHYLDRTFMSPDFSGRRGPSYYVADQMEEVDGHPCHVVQISWNRRTMDLWLDPAMGCLPRKYLMRNDLWRGQDPRNGGSRTAPGTGLRIDAPADLERTLGNPVAYEERMERIELATFGDRPYIARAYFEKVLYFEQGKSHIERVDFKVDTIAPSNEAETAPFLAFAGLMGNGDRVRLFEPGGDGIYMNMAWQDGQLAALAFSPANLASTLQQSFRRFTRNFRLENLGEMDFPTVVGVCVILAVGINGGLIWMSYRRRRAAEGTQARERVDAHVAE